LLLDVSTLDYESSSPLEMLGFAQNFVGCPCIVRALLRSQIENVSEKRYWHHWKFYGKTKRGKFMSEDDAKKAGYREAKTEAAPKAKAKTADTKK
jgi:hypothetical protein